MQCVRVYCEYKCDTYLHLEARSVILYVCMYMLCVWIWMINTCMWRPVQDIGFFSLNCFLPCCAMAVSVTQPEGEHLCWPSRIHCSTPPTPSPRTTCACSHAQLFLWLLPLPLHRKHFAQWDITIPPYACTAFDAQWRANKLSYSCPQAFWYRNRSVGDSKC